MAHKYDDCYTKSGCAYWRTVDTWSKRRCARDLRRKLHIRCKTSEEDVYTDDVTNHWWYWVHLW